MALRNQSSEALLAGASRGPSKRRRAPPAQPLSRRGARPGRPRPEDSAAAREGAIRFRRRAMPPSREPYPPDASRRPRSPRHGSGRSGLAVLGDARLRQRSRSVRSPGEHGGPERGRLRAHGRCLPHLSRRREGTRGSGVDAHFGAQSAAYDGLEPLHDCSKRLLEALNQHLVREFPDGDLQFAGRCLDIWVTDAGVAHLRYSNAGGLPFQRPHHRAPGTGGLDPMPIG